jgi:hypothetical protein
VLTKTPAATFIRQYIEMVVVMFAGMLVLGLPGEAAMKAMGSGTSELRGDAPAVVFLGLAATMRPSRCSRGCATADTAGSRPSRWPPR